MKTGPFGLYSWDMNKQPLLLAVLTAGLLSPAASAQSPDWEMILKQAPPAPAPTPAPAPAPGAAFAGLKAGVSDARSRREIPRVKKILKAWNPRLPMTAGPAYDEDLTLALTLFKAVYGSGRDGRAIDPATAALLEARENGTFAAVAPKKTPGQETLYQAAAYLGLPYYLNGDGVHNIDCALLTKLALFKAGVVPESFTRAADYQYRDARLDGTRLTGFRPGEAKPRAGDLVFFQWTYNPNVAGIFEGITHVGLYVSDGYILAASGRGVVIQPIGEVGHPAYAYARPRLVASR